MQATIEHFDTTKHWAMLPFFMASAAELRGQVGDRTRAAALIDRAFELVGNTGEKWCAAEIIRLRALFSARDEDEKLALLQDSLAMATSQGAMLWQLRTATSLAELLRGQGDKDRAQALLAPICGSFTEGANMRDLIYARTLLAMLGK